MAWSSVQDSETRDVRRHSVLQSTCLRPSSPPTNHGIGRQVRLPVHCRRPALSPVLPCVPSATGAMRHASASSALALAVGWQSHQPTAISSAATWRLAFVGELLCTELGVRHGVHISDCRPPVCVRADGARVPGCTSPSLLCWVGLLLRSARPPALARTTFFLSSLNLFLSCVAEELCRTRPLPPRSAPPQRPSRSLPDPVFNRQSTYSFPCSSAWVSQHTPRRPRSFL